MTRYVMVADLERCVGCQTCTSACKHTNATPPLVQWRKVLDVEAGEYPNVSRTFVPVGCMHCADPPCMHVCPSTATGQRADGIVTIDYDLCIGCAYCAVACPYQARYKVDKPLFAYGNIEIKNEAAREEPRRLGVAQKCTFCSDRVDYGIANGLTPGVDPDATPACVNSCIADALHFGDIEDKDSNVSILLRENKNFRMHEELGTNPGFYYLYDDATPEEVVEATRGPAPDTVEHDAHMPGVQPWQQTHWDWRAALNFIGGGTGSGLLITTALMGWGYGMPVFPAGIIALALVGLGLFSVWMEIGRPWRALHVVFHPQTSWMTREALVAMPLFALGVLALWTGMGWFTGLAAFVAFGFLYCQGRILFQAKGIPIWRERRIIPFIMATGLAEAAGLLLALGQFHAADSPAVRGAAIGLVAMIGLRVVTWRLYMNALQRSGAPKASLQVLNDLAVPFSLGGHLLPVALVGVAFFYLPAASLLFAAAGIVAMLSGWYGKYIIVTRASYNQGFAINHTPSRGSSQPGPGVKPGWSL